MNAAPIPEPDEKEPISIQDRAIDNIAFIRETMATSKSFTGVPGWGMVAMGLVALAGAYIATRTQSYDWWVNTWAIVAVIGGTTGVVALAFKSRRRKTPVLLRRTSLTSQMATN